MLYTFGISKFLYIYSKGANMKANFSTKYLANIFDFAVIFRLIYMYLHIFTYLRNMIQICKVYTHSKKV